MKKKIHVVGAGIAGMSAAYFLSQHDFEVSLYEASSRVGGLIETKHGKFGLVESAAPAFMNSAFLETLCGELDLDMVASKPLAKRNRFLENGEQVSRWPLTILETLRFLLGVLWFRWFAPKPRQTVAQWSDSVFGRATTQKLLGKALQGIYATSADKLSASLVIRRFYERKNRREPRPKKRGSVAPRLGMQEFIDKLKAGFLNQEGKLYLNTSVAATQLEQWIAAGDTVVLAVPVWIASQLLVNLEPNVACDFMKVPALPLESTTVFWERGRSQSLRPGFGILFDLSKKSANRANVLGVLENDQIFERRVWSDSVISETWISSGLGQETLSAIKQKRSELLKNADTGILLEHSVSGWTRAIPEFGLELELAMSKGHSTRLENRGIYLVGNYAGPIGVAKIVERSWELAETLKKSHLGSGV